MSLINYKKILLVDDEEDNLLLLRVLLKKINADLTFANGGPKALELLKDNYYDIILLDLNMPNISGVDVADYLRKLPSKGDSIILALTALGRDEISDSTLDLFDDLLRKPFKKDRLLSTLQHYLDSNNT